MTFEHISEPLTRAIETMAKNYGKGHPMRVRITATVTYETDLDAELYAYLETPPKTDAEIFAWETDAIGNGDTPLVESLRDWGNFTNAKIERVEDEGQILPDLEVA